MTRRPYAGGAAGSFLVLQENVPGINCCCYLPIDSQLDWQ